MENNSVIFRVFRTYRKNYVYDRHTNSVFAVNEEEYQELRNVEKGILSPEKSEVIKKYQKEGLFKPNVVKTLWHPQTRIMEHHAQKRLKQLILQVTQQCNLRCEYCAYSGIYEGNRTHADKKMSFETAKKTIDFFFEHSVENPDVVIGFYGGEPLLEFELIKQCVAYINEINEGKNIRFGMTTNGTLLKGERAKFLAEHEFVIGISLDGSKSEHDACRKFPDGTGSFDIVINNIKNLTELYPDYVKNKVSFYTTVNPYMDLGCVLEYFSASDIINDNSIMFNSMVSVNLKEELPYKESFFQIRKYEYIKMLFSLVNKLDKKYVSRLTSGAVDQAIRIKRALHRKGELGENMHPGGPCMPGVLRLFVRYDGKFFPCERVNESLDFYNIGSVSTGFDLERMRDILNIGRLTEEECKKCWNLRHCMLCSSEIEFHGGDVPCKEDKLKICKTKKLSTESDLYEQCVLQEFGYALDAEVM